MSVEQDMWGPNVHAEINEEILLNQEAFTDLKW